MEFTWLTAAPSTQHARNKNRSLVSPQLHVCSDVRGAPNQASASPRFAFNSSERFRAALDLAQTFSRLAQDSQLGVRADNTQALPLY